MESIEFVWYKCANLPAGVERVITKLGETVYLEGHLNNMLYDDQEGSLQQRNQQSCVFLLLSCFILLYTSIIKVI
jgi:hypothetical protein